MATAANLDSCRPLKSEQPSEGGTQTDYGPTEVTTTQDALAAAGYYVDGPSVTTPDKTVLVDRASGGNLRLTDQAAQQVLSNVVGASYAGSQPHSGLPDASHLDAFGPDAGWTSGAYEQRVMSGPLLTNVVWWTSSSMTQKIYSISVQYSGPLPTTITRTTYTSTGATLRTFTETLSYSGPLLTGRLRSWT